MNTKNPALLPQTASQTAGPYVHIGLAPGAAGLEVCNHPLGTDIAGPDTEGLRIRVEGCIFDGAGDPVKDAVIEVWQADAAGRFAPDAPQGFRGWGRAISDFDTGLWSVDTIKPGAVPSQSDAAQAPHLSLWIVARGINMGLHTRVYFDDEASNASDPVLMAIHPDARRQTLIASRRDDSEVLTYRFDIRLQGEGETVFFDP